MGRFPGGAGSTRDFHAGSCGADFGSGFSDGDTARLALFQRVCSRLLQDGSCLAWLFQFPLFRSHFLMDSVWILLLFGSRWDRRWVWVALFSVAVLINLYGVINAAVVRVKRVTVHLPNWPDHWRGLVAALGRDMHVGPVRGDITKRIVKMLGRCQPDVVLIGGDMYDGTAADIGKLAEPFKDISAPMGTYFVEGNHEEFSDHTKYLDAVQKSGVRVLNNEKVDADGLQIVGVHYRDANDPERLRGILRRADLDADRASILLTHAPNQLWIAAEEKVGLQLSGHTHGGPEFFPFTWITSRIYGRFVYGLQRLEDMFVYTSCGVGTWGLPMRVGTRPGDRFDPSRRELEPTWASASFGSA